MLTRSNQLVDKDSYYSTALNTTPTYKQSIFDGFSMGATGGYTALNMLDSKYTQSPEGQAALSSYKAMQLEADAPGQGFLQRRAGDVASIVGSALNPITWIGGGLGEAASEALGTGASKAIEALPDSFGVLARTPLSKLLPKPVSRFVSDTTAGDQPISTAFISDKLAKGGLTAVGATVPQEVVDNYQMDTNHIDWGGVARGAGEMGGLGMAIGALPIAFGMLRGKINRANGDLPDADVDKANLDKTLAAGNITPDEHAWYSDFLQARENPKDAAAVEDLKQRASGMVNSNGGKANTATNEAGIDLINPQGIQNLQSVLVDQGLSDLPENQKSALSNFVIHHSIDELSGDQPTLDGIRGYLDMTKGKLDARAEKTAEADEITDKYLTRGVNENMPFSQKEIYRAMKKMGFERSHVDNLPMIVPDNLKKRMVIDEKINKLVEKNKRLQSKKIKNMGAKVHEEINREGNINSLSVHYPEGDKLGDIVLYPYEGGYKVTQTYMPSEYRGKGLGKGLYKEAIDYALKKGKKFYSDMSLSKDAMRIYQSLMRHGYKFEENKNYHIDEEGRRVSDDKRPLFTLLEAPKEVSKNKQTERRINELEASKPKILTPKEELNHLRQQLLGKGLSSKFRQSPEYQRLLDLSNVWGNARTLLDRVHLEDQYNRQAALHSFLSDVVQSADGNLKQLADPAKAMDYLRNRIEKKITNTMDDAGVRAIKDKYTEVPQDADRILSDSQMDFANTKAKGALEDFNKAKDKFDEAKKKESVFRNLIACVTGALNG